jgi:integrase
MSKQDATRRRARGTGSLRIVGDHWYGRWYVGTQRVERAVGPVRKRGTRVGLTEGQAEVKLRELMTDPATAPTSDAVTVEQAGARLLSQLRRKNRAPSHIETAESHIRVHLVPFFEARRRSRVHNITEDDVEALMDHLADTGRKPKTVRNVVSTLHSILDLARRKRWVHENVCGLVERPEVPEDPDTHFLTVPELGLLVSRGAADAPELTELERAWRRVERPLYLMAALTGKRQGELFAVRWLDIDWTAMKVRVRKNYVRGQMRDYPKGRRGRVVPMAEMLAAELERLFQSSAYQADADLVFGHPHSGKPLDRSKVRKRYLKALDRAGLRHVRFHDLRHTFGTHMAAEGAPMRSIQAWYGHKDSKTTDIYVGYQPGEEDSALVDRAFGGLSLPPNFPQTEANSDQLRP